MYIVEFIHFEWTSWTVGQLGSSQFQTFTKECNKQQQRYFIYRQIADRQLNTPTHLKIKEVKEERQESYAPTRKQFIWLNSKREEQLEKEPNSDAEVFLDHEDENDATKKSNLTK